MTRRAEEYTFFEFPQHDGNGIHVSWIFIIFVVSQMMKFKDCWNFVVATV